MQRKNIIPKIKKWVGKEEGIINHNNRARNRDIIGVNKKGRRLDRDGLDCSFLSNFKASARG